MIADELESTLDFLVVILVIGLFAVVSYFIEARNGNIGMTTEVAIIISMLIGALCYWGYITLAVAIGIATTTLLSLKVETDRLVHFLTLQVIASALQLAVISAIVLPVLPNRSLFLEPFDVLNPFKIWLMVVFISGISFLGYIAIKVFWAERSIGLTSFLGGLVSSTAETLSFSERSKEDNNLSKPFALVIILAWTVIFARILVEVGVVNINLLRIIWIPIVTAVSAGLLYCVYLYISQRAGKSQGMEFSNPFE